MTLSNLTTAEILARRVSELRNDLQDQHDTIAKQEGFIDALENECATHVKDKKELEMEIRALHNDLERLGIRD